MALERLGERVDALEAEVFGPTRDPDRKSMRMRLHKLENEAAAAKVAEKVLEHAKSQYRAADAQTFTRRVALAGIGLTVLNVLIAVLLR